VAEQTEEGVLRTALDIERMYYFAARRALESAKTAWPAVERGIKDCRNLAQQVEDVRKTHELAGTDDSRELEPLCIRLMNWEEHVGFQYAPILEQIAIAQVMSAACLEAHINRKAKEHLKGKMSDEFDCLSIMAKWLYLPKILGLKGFDPGAFPYQGFDQLIKWRNLLAHYKHMKKEVWNRGPVPSFLKDLGLSIPQAEESVKATRAMIDELADQLGEPVEPAIWDGDMKWSYFILDTNPTTSTAKRIGVVDNTEETQDGP
jgi:hypothetical protein